MRQKILKNACFVKCLIIWITFYPNTRAFSEKNTTHNITFQKCLKNGNQLLIRGNRLSYRKYRKFVLSRTKNLGFSFKGAQGALNFLSAFKKAIKKWKSPNCPHRRCKKYVQNLSFI